MSVIVVLVVVNTATLLCVCVSHSTTKKGTTVIDTERQSGQKMHDVTQSEKSSSL